MRCLSSGERSPYLIPPPNKVRPELIFWQVCRQEGRAIGGGGFHKVLLCGIESSDSQVGHLKTGFSVDNLKRIDLNSSMMSERELPLESASEAQASKQGSGPAQTQSGWFTTTHWSVVSAAGQRDCPEAFGALDRLCRTYWYPLYAYLRRKGFGPHDAQDTTQSFFERFLEKDCFSRADPEKGKFRSFLLAPLENFLSDQLKFARAQKRGGGQPVISIDEMKAEDCYRCEPLDTHYPARAYERDWTMTVLTHAMDSLKAGLEAEGGGQRFEDLKPFLLEEEDADYTAVCKKLGISIGAARTAVCRLRERFRVLLEEEIAQTVGSAEEVEAEINYLISVLSN
jgi:DNA-directed RNA polymerase specialized sigma24 family protein